MRLNGAVVIDALAAIDTPASIRCIGGEHSGEDRSTDLPAPAPARDPPSP
jgi:hypothetical protein